MHADLSLKSTSRAAGRVVAAALLVVVAAPQSNAGEQSCAAVAGRDPVPAESLSRAHLRSAVTPPAVRAQDVVAAESRAAVAAGASAVDNRQPPSELLQRLVSASSPVDFKRSVATSQAATYAPTPAPQQAVAAVDDTMISTSWYMFTTGANVNVNDPNGPNDYLSSRFYPSQLAKQMPFSVNGMWMNVDDYVSWATDWEMQVLLENPAIPFTPDLSRSLGVATFNSSTIWPTRGPGPGIADVQNARIPFATPLAYPTTAMFSINDGANDDDFTWGPDDLQSGSWAECTDIDCAPATVNLGVEAGGVVTRGPGTSLGWRFPTCDLSAPGEDCWRYFHGYVGLNLVQVVPDDDVRLTADYDVSTGERAGVFVRADRDRFAGRLTNYYSIYVDQGTGEVVIAANEHDAGDLPVETILASQTIAIPDTGTLAVEIEGFDPVQIRVYLNGSATPTLSHSDTTFLFHGDPPDWTILGWTGGGLPLSIHHGNIFGVIFPNGIGGEQITDFQTDRHADLFATAKMPAPPPGQRNVTMLFDPAEESRQYFGLYFTTDGTTWNHFLGVGAGANCSQNWNLHMGIEVSDPNTNPGAGNSLFQANSTLAALHLPCCGCSTELFDCGTAGFKDACFPVSAWVGGQSPIYDASSAIEIVPRMIFDRSPDHPVGALSFTIWQVCNRAESATQCNDRCVGPGFENCGGITVPLDTAGGFRGINYRATSDDDLDGEPDGPLALFLQTTPPQEFIPPSNGDYTVFVWELYDLDGDGNIDNPTTDDFQANLFVTRNITVAGGCSAAPPYDFLRNTFRMGNDSLTPCPAGQVSALWEPISFPNDEPANIHEVVGRTALEVEMGPCAADAPNLGLGLPPGLEYGCNPWPATSNTFTGLSGGAVCITPSSTLPGASYYAMFADDCGASIADDK